MTLNDYNDEYDDSFTYWDIGQGNKPEANDWINLWDAQQMGNHGHADKIMVKMFFGDMSTELIEWIIDDKLPKIREDHGGNDYRC